MLCSFLIFKSMVNAISGVMLSHDQSEIVIDCILCTSFLLLFLHCFCWFRRNYCRPCSITSLYHGAPWCQKKRGETCKKAKYKLLQATSHSSLLVACQGDVSRKLNQPFLLVDLFNFNFCCWRTFRYIYFMCHVYHSHWHHLFFMTYSL